MNRVTYFALRCLLDALRDEERKHWEEAGEPPIGHLYNIIVQLDGWCAEVAKDY